MKIIFSKIFLIIAFSVFTELGAQNSSSYSRFGLGDLDYSYSIRKMGMGQLGISIADVDFISIINPASLFKIGKTRMEFSLNYNGTFLADNFQKKYYAETEFGGFCFGFPVSPDNGIGAAIGLVPFSNVSYKVVENVVSNNPIISDYQIEYAGKGGLSKAFLSTSFLFPFDLSIGTSLDYYFGNIDYISSVDFSSSSSLSSSYIRNHSYRGVGGTFGFISPDVAKLFEIKSISDFRFGMSVNVFTNLTDDTLHTSESILHVDTLNSGRGKVSLPVRLMTGISLILNNKYLLSLDYCTQAFSNFNSNGFTSSVLRNASKVSAGFEYRPQRELGSTFLEQIILRAGLSYEQTQYLLNNIGINQYSISIGASLPLSYENTLDIALAYSRRGTKDLNLLQEDIIKLGIGFSLGELWFIRQEK